MDKKAYKVWLDYYKKVTGLGRLINHYRKRGMDELYPEEFQELLVHLNKITLACSRFLDKNGAKMPTPTWWYLPDDETTHASSPKFKYAHLVGHDVFHQFEMAA